MNNAHLASAYDASPDHAAGTADPKSTEYSDARSCVTAMGSTGLYSLHVKVRYVEGKNFAIVRRMVLNILRLDK